MMKVNEAVARTLSDIGIQTMFGVIGDANLFVVDAYTRDYGGDYVSAANEAGAVLMALGYAWVSRRTGVATVTCGPGLTNTFTALAEGVRSRLPMVLLTADSSSAIKYHPQKITHRAFAAATGAGFEQANSLKSVSEDLVHAFRRAQTEQLPIVFNMPPYDLHWEDAVYYQPPKLTAHHRASKAVDSPDLEDAVGLIASAKRPIVLAGRGVVAEQARDAVLQLAKRLDAPLMTTLKAKDLFRDEPANLGVFGVSSRPEAIEPITKCDCVIAFGASLNFFTTAKGSFVDDKRIVFVNNDATEIDKHIPVDVAVLGDCASTAQRFIHWLDEAEIPSSGFASEGDVREAAQAVAAPQPVKSSSRQNALDITEVLQAVDAMFTRERVLVTGGGRHMGHPWACVHVTDPRLFIPSGLGIGQIGVDYPMAIGAAKAEPGLPVVVVTGDGSFMLGGIADFNTAVRYQLDIIMFVCNDGGYGAEHDHFTNRGMDPSLSLFDWPDFARVAEALGGQGLSVHSMDDMAAVQAAIANRTRRCPILVDVKLDPNNIPSSF